MQSSTGAMLQSANLFVFVMNNPIRFIDPTGFAAVDVILRYIVERNEGTVTTTQRETFGISWGLESVTATIGETSHTFNRDQFRIVNSRAVVSSQLLMDTFGLTQAQATHHAYDRFGSKEDALLAWGLMFHPRSGPTSVFPNGSEFGAWIYRDSSGRYMFGSDQPDRGETFVNFGAPNSSFTAVGIIHTHPRPGVGFDVERFSFQDGRAARQIEAPVFLVTPAGHLRRLDPSWAHQDGDGVISNRSRHVTTLFNILR